MAHEVFHYHSKQEIEQTARAQGVFLPWSEDTAVLAQPLSIGAHTARNRIALQPMEGTDGTAEGAPFSREQLNAIIDGAMTASQTLTEKQKEALGDKWHRIMNEI